MDSTDLDTLAASLKIYLQSLADSPNHVSVSANNKVLHVYTKRKFHFAVPETWEGVTVYHHRKSNKVMAYNRLSYQEA